MSVSKKHLLLIIGFALYLLGIRDIELALAFIAFAMAAQQGDSIETLYVDIAARADQLVEDANEAVERVIKALDKVEDKTKETETAFGKLGGFIKQALSTAAGIGLAQIGGSLVGAITDFGKAMITSNAQMQTYQKSFEVLTGSAEEAGATIEWIKEQAKLTPFDVPGLISASQMLMTWGLDLHEWFTIVGDTAAAMNKPLQQVVGAIGTLASGQTGEAVMRFRDLGVNLREVAELQFDARGAMVTPIEEAVPIVRKVLEDKFGGMMEAQSKTWTGVVSNMMDTWQQFVQVVGEPVFEILNEALVNLQAWMDENTDSIEQFARDFGALLGTALTALMDLMAAMGQLISLIDQTLQRITGSGIVETLEKGIVAARQISGIVGGGLRGGAELVGGLIAGRDLEEATDAAAEAAFETMQAIGGVREETEKATEAVRELTEAQEAGLDAARRFSEETKKMTDEELAVELALSQVTEAVAIAADQLSEAGITSQETADAYREQTEDLRALNAAYVEGARAYEENIARIEEMRAKLAALRAEQEENLALAQEVAAKLGDRMTQAMERYEEAVEKAAAATAEAITEIEAEAAQAEAAAVAQHQADVTKLREDFAREQVRRRKQFNQEWARLLREQNQEVIDAEWEYQFQKENIMIEGDEIALAELEARYDHEKDVRAREQGDARSDFQQRWDNENEQRQEQFEEQLEMLNARLAQEITQIRATAAEEVRAAREALDEKVANEDAVLQERLARIGEMLAQEVGENQVAADIILQAWSNMYGAQVAEAVNAGMVMRAELDAIMQQAIVTAAAVANVRLGAAVTGAGRPAPPRRGERRQAGGYSPPEVAPVMMHPGEFVLNAGTTAAIEAATGGALTQQTMRSLVQSQRTLDVNVQGSGVGADTILRIERELIDALREESLGL